MTTADIRKKADGKKMVFFSERTPRARRALVKRCRKTTPKRGKKIGMLTVKVKDIMLSGKAKPIPKMMPYQSILLRMEKFT